MSASQLYIGTSGIVLPYKNQLAYPESLQGQSRLSVYSTLFNSLEVNSIFYKLHRAPTIAQWSESVTKDFRFTFKLWKQITHSPALDFDEADLIKYFDVIAAAKDKSGCLLVQFPASVKCNLFIRVEHLLTCINQYGNGLWPIAVEFRSSCWYDDQTYELLNRHQATMVYHDKRGSESPQPEFNAGHIYLRFHGPMGDYKGSYDTGWLYEYAGYVADWLLEDKDVYVYFNNTMGNALGDVKRFRQFVDERFHAS